jgi:hypothetical protein
MKKQQQQNDWKVFHSENRESLTCEINHSLYLSIVGLFITSLSVK